MDADGVQEQPETQCQYFVLSPRPSLGGSPCSRAAEGDENADCNILAPSGEGLKKAVARRCNQDSHLFSTPNKSGSDMGNVLTPHLCQTLVVPLMPPDREDCEPSVTSISVCSEPSRESRLTQLSRRNTIRRHLSSKELEEIQVEQKRREVQELMRRNQVNCRRALNATDLSSAARAFARPSRPTAPRDLRCAMPSTPRTPRAEGGGSDRAALAKQWRPQLTVPRGPELHTTRRLSSCGPQRSTSCPPEEVNTESEKHQGEVRPARFTRASTPPSRRPEQPARASTPESRRLEVYAAAARAERRAAAAARGATAPAAGGGGGSGTATPCSAADAAAGPRPGRGTPATAQERAQLARILVQQRKDEEARAAQERMYVFKRPAAGAQKPRQLVNPPPDWEDPGAPEPHDRPGKTRPASARGPTPRASFGSTTARPCLSTATS